MPTTTTPSMALVLPVVSSELGPLWATEVNAAFTRIDGHTHSSGYGVQITPSGMNINADLSFNPSGGTVGANATGLRSTRYVNQSALLAGASDLCASYFSGGDLYIRNGSGNNVRITNGASLDTTTLVSNVWVRVAKATDYTILAADTQVFFDIDCSGGTRLITLPAANAVTAGRLYSICDTTGNAATNNITIARAGADTIDGGTSYVIRSNYGEVLLRSDGTSKWKVLQSGNAVNGASVPAAGALTTGNVLQVTGTGALSYAPINLAAASTNYYTGRLPSANLFQATAGAEGAVQLAGDLAGTGSVSTAPTVSGLTGAAGVASIACATVSFGSGVASPLINQVTIAGAAQDLTITSQPSSTTSGGRLVLGSGTGSAATDSNAGDIRLKRGATTWMDITGSKSSMVMGMATPAAAGTGITFQLAGSNANTSGTGGQINFTAGNAAGVDQNGGAVLVRSGTATGVGKKGSVTLQLGNSSSVTALHAAEVASGRHIVALMGTVAAANVPGAIDGGIFIPNCTAVADTNTVGGGVLFCSAGALYWRSTVTGSNYLIAAA